MNRLLQHFVDSSGAQGAPASRPPIPAPPQSSGGSYHGGNRGSYQRAAPGGPFYYQPPPNHWQQPPPHGGASGLEEIPLTSQSSGSMYETVDLNADTSQQQQQQQQQQLFAPPPGNRLPSSPGQSYGTPLYKTPTPPGSREGNRQPIHQQKTPGSTGSAAELFASGPPPPAKELFGGPPSGGSGGGNPYRRQATPMNNIGSPFVASGHGAGGREANNASPANVNGGAGVFGHNIPQKDPFATPPANGAARMFGNNTSPSKDLFAAQNGGGGLFSGQAPQDDPFAASHSEENRNVFGNGTPGAEASAIDPFAAQPPKDTSFRHDQQGPQQQQSQQQPASAAGDPFASAPSHSDSSLFGSPAPSNGEHQRMSSADSLFGSPAPTNNGDWAHPAPFPQPTQPAPNPVQAQELFTSEAPSASSLFGGEAPSPFQIGHPKPPNPHTNASPSPAKPQVGVPPSPVKPQVSVLPSPAKSLANVPSSHMKPPVATPPSPRFNASSPSMRPLVTVPASPVMRPEDHLTPAFGSMKLSAPAKSPLKSGLDVRHMKFPAGKREDDAISNAPSIAPSRMSMLSTLDDSLKLSDMYKQMTARLEGEKHDLLKVVASQAQEIAKMKKHIKSLELQLKKCRPQDA